MAFIDLLTQIGFTNAQATAIIEEGITDPEDLVTYTHSDIKTYTPLLDRSINSRYCVIG
jgi:hypothetical protein